jgi:hypothetical protein
MGSVTEVQKGNLEAESELGRLVDDTMRQHAERVLQQYTVLKMLTDAQLITPDQVWIAHGLPLPRPEVEPEEDTGEDWEGSWAWTVEKDMRFEEQQAAKSLEDAPVLSGEALAQEYQRVEAEQSAFLDEYLARPPFDTKRLEALEKVAKVARQVWKAELICDPYSDELQAALDELDAALNEAGYYGGWAVG